MPDLFPFIDEHPQNDFLMDREAEAIAMLQIIEKKRSEFSYHTSVSRWTSKVDRCNKDFFFCVSSKTC
eukprot:c31057_g1_i1 orf=140-343(+)